MLKKVSIFSCKRLTKVDLSGWKRLDFMLRKVEILGPQVPRDFRAWIKNIRYLSFCFEGVRESITLFSEA